MLYELRFYDPHPGRLPDLLTRFRDGLPPLFTRHGIRCAGRWLTEEMDAAICSPATRFAYLTLHPDMARRDAVWAAFGGDPQWHRLRAQSNGASEMLRGYNLHFLRQQLDQDLRQDMFCAAGSHELLFFPVAHGEGARFSNWLRETARPALADAGAALIGCFDIIAGTNLPQCLLWIVWPDSLGTARANSVLRARPDSLASGPPLWSRGPATPVTMRCVG